MSGFENSTVWQTTYRHAGTGFDLCEACVRDDAMGMVMHHKNQSECKVKKVDFYHIDFI